MKKGQPMSEEQRERMRSRWTPEMRAEQSEKVKAQYAAWAARHPDRAAVVAKLWADVATGVVERPGCVQCGRPMNPTYDWTELVVTGWRCRTCR